MNWFPYTPGVYLVSDRHRCGTEQIASILIAAMQQGVAAVQLRERDLADAPFLHLAQTIRLQGPAHVPLLLNRRPHLVRAANANGIQIGSAELPHIYEYRRLMPVHALVGVSCHNEAEVQSAYLAEADFVVVGPIYPTTSKPGVVPTISAEDVALWQQRYALPIIPIGGIGALEAASLRALGLQRIACMGSVLSIADAKVRQAHLAQLQDLLLA